MNLLADIHGYPPYHNSGAEWMAHHIFKSLVPEHNVTVLLNFNSYLGIVKKDDYWIDGVRVEKDELRDKWYKWADIVFTHLDKSGLAYNYCRSYNKPLIHMIHNNYGNVTCEKLSGINQYAIYNTHWVRNDRKEAHSSIMDSIIVHPPITVEDYQTKHINHFITLINLNHNKGGDFLIQLANKLPDRMFMGVWGTYGEQIFDDKIKNINYIQNTAEIVKRVYRRTRILIMPSIYESYGRTAIEACASGIPVICNDTPGLRESLGDVGLYCNRNNINEWIWAIKALDNPSYYDEISEKCKQRALDLDPKAEISELRKFLIKVKDESKSFKDPRNRTGRQVAESRASS